MVWMSTMLARSPSAILNFSCSSCTCTGLQLTVLEPVTSVLHAVQQHIYIGVQQQNAAILPRSCIASSHTGLGQVTATGGVVTKC